MFRFALALVLLTTTCAGGAETAETQFDVALRLAASGRFAEAEQILLTLEKGHPKEYEIVYRLGLVLLRMGKTSHAIMRFERATALRPVSAPAWVALARARLQSGSTKAALDAAERAAAIAETEPQIFRALALFYADSEQFANAARFEERWHQASPGDLESAQRAADYHIAAASQFRSANLTANAVEAYQHAIRLAPGEQRAYYGLATLLLDHRTPQPAVAVLTSATSRFAREPEYQRLLGLAWYQLGDIDRAIEAFLKACDLSPDAEVSYASFETLLSEAGPHLTNISTRLRSFRERHATSPVGHYLLAKVLSIQGGDTADIEGLLRQAVTAEPRFWPAHYELGQLLAGQARRDAALSALKRTVELNDKYAPAHYTLARLYADAGDRDRAIAHRKVHHALLSKEREATERQRSAAPALLYRMEGNSK